MAPPIDVRPIDPPAPRWDRMRCVVEAQDVEQGVRCRADACPVKLAMTRLLGREVRVTATGWCYYDQSAPELLQGVPGTAGMHDLPPEVCAAIHEFDVTGVFPMPCAFEFDP